MSKANHIKIKASLDPNKQCLKIFGDGAASITFNTDATQLANAIRTVALFKGKCIELNMRGLPQDNQNAGQKKRTQVRR